MVPSDTQSGSRRKGVSIQFLASRFTEAGNQSSKLVISTIVKGRQAAYVLLWRRVIRFSMVTSQ